MSGYAFIYTDSILKQTLIDPFMWTYMMLAYN
jgi:hypothetical protein